MKRAPGSVLIQITSQWHRCVCEDAGLAFSFTDHPRKARAFPSIEAAEAAARKLPRISDFAPPTTYRIVRWWMPWLKRRRGGNQSRRSRRRSQSGCSVTASAAKCAEDAEQVIELATMQKLLDDDRETQILDLIVDLRHLHDQLPASDESARSGAGSAARERRDAPRGRSGR
jgi:hypothetical protein